MGNCYCKQGPVILNQSELEVFETVGKKEEVYKKKEEIIKLDFKNLSPRNNISKLKRNKSSIKRVSFAGETNIEEEKKKEKEKEKEKKKNDNNNFVKRRVKQKIIQTVKSPLELAQMNNLLKLKIDMDSINNDSINKDKDSILYFNSQNDSEISKNNNESSKKKFKRNNKKSVTRVDKPIFCQKLINYEMSIPILTETLIIQQKGNLKENYEIKKKIGAGPFGSVYKARNIYLKNTVAIKMIKKEKQNKEDDLIIEEQINLLKKLNHPNIVKIHEFYSNSNYYQIITEYCKKGELLKYIKRKYDNIL